MNIIPRGNRVLVDVVFDVTYEDRVINTDGEGEFVEGSSVIIAPKIEKQEIRTPTDRCVIVVGNERIDDLQEGDLCIFNERTGHKVTYQGKEYLLLTDPDIYAVIES